MKNGYTLTVTDQPGEADLQIVREALDAHNAAQGAPVDWVQMAVFVRDAQGTVVGGLTGGTYWGWLYIGRLWVAEQEALRRGCHHAYLDTQDFHALPFYRQHGYTIYGELENIPIGHKRYSMQKKL
jgi:GNAT superfamily N-acetyltransferase